MSEELFNLIDKADAEFNDITEFTAAIIELSRHSTVTETLLDLLNSAIVHHEKFWSAIESSEEFKVTYHNDRLQLLKAFGAQRAPK